MIMFHIYVNILFFTQFFYFSDKPCFYCVNSTYKLKL